MPKRSRYASGARPSNRRAVKKRRKIYRARRRAGARSTRSLALTALRGLRRIRELKFHLENGHDKSEPYGDFRQLSMPPVGDDEKSRDGNQIWLKNLMLNMVHNPPPFGDTNFRDHPFKVRVVVFMWMDESTPSDVDLFASPYGIYDNAGVLTAAYLRRTRNVHQRKKKLRILFDGEQEVKYHSIPYYDGTSNVTNPTQSTRVRPVSFVRHIPIKQKIVYDPATTLWDKEIWMAVYNNYNVAAATEYTYNTRLSFTG